MNSFIFLPKDPYDPCIMERHRPLDRSCVLCLIILIGLGTIGPAPPYLDLGVTICLDRFLVAE